MVRPRFLSLLLVSSVVAFACGGKVTVDPPSTSAGAGGAGAAGSSDTSAQNASAVVNGTSVVASGTGGSPSSLCQQVCDSVASLGCPVDPNCVNGCVQSFAEAGECVPQLTAFAQCVIANPPKDCDLANTCPGELDAYMECIQNMGGCDPNQQCEQGSDGTCSCNGICGGNKVQTDCKPTDSGEICACSINGQQVGSCQDPQGQCDVQFGCCAQFW